MITDWLISIMVSVVNFFDTLLPHFDMSSAWFSWLTTNAFSTTIGNYVGGLLAPISSWFPVDAFLNVLYALLIFLPAVAAYEVFQWVWRHVPTIAGFGTGNG
jgi:hypothetical protein